MTTLSSGREVFIDPSSKAYYKDGLFDTFNAVLNRDDTLAPFVRLRHSEQEQGASLRTADYLMRNDNQGRPADYYSLGVLENYKILLARSEVTLRAFVILEPPVVDPRLYRALPELTSAFERVYVHNTSGDGYSLKNVQQLKLHKLHWPQPRKEVILTLWNRRDRLDRIVVINGNHRPRPVKGELYSKRIEAMTALAKLGVVDLYGRGWEQWWSRSSMWLPYWRNRQSLMGIYKGACDSKFEVLSQYKFCLCFENMAMQGYITEKIFDCFYAGTIPLYLGATDIADLIPADAYIDCRRFSSWEQMSYAIAKLPSEKIESLKNAGREFVKSPEGLMYFNSLTQIFNVDSMK
jgi:hypothetical protein